MMEHEDPHVYTDEEINMLLQSDRREIDRLMLMALNRLVKAFLDFKNKDFYEHASKEEQMHAALGAANEVKIRMEWLGIQIERERDRSKLRKRVIESSILWAVPIILAFYFTAISDGVRGAVIKWIWK